MKKKMKEVNWYLLTMSPQNEGAEVKKDLFNCTTFSDDSLFSSGLIRLVPPQGVTVPDNVR